MPTYRHGALDGFFDGVTAYNATTNLRGGVAVNAGNVSIPVQVGRSADNFCFYVNASGASKWQLQVAHQGDQTSEGIFPDPLDANMSYSWFDVWYLGTSGSGNSTAIYIDMAGAASIASLVPDWEPNWVRLKCVTGSNITVTAGWEIQSD